MLKKIYMWVAETYQRDFSKNSWQYVLEGDIQQDKQLRAGELVGIAKKIYDLCINSRKSYFLNNGPKPNVPFISLTSDRNIVINRAFREDELGKLEKEILRIYYS